jgi:prevent-host-death family protein
MTVSVVEAKTRLSRLLQQLAAGEEVITTRSGQRVARLVPTEETRPAFGVDEGRVVVPDDFDDPLDEELLRAFEGQTRQAPVE